MQSILSKIRKDIRHTGFAKTAYRLFMEVVNMCLDLRIVKAFKVEVVNPDFLKREGTFHCKFLDEAEMLELTRNPELHVTEQFVRTALEKGDDCHAGFDGEELACFSWYSNQPTDDEGFVFHFSPDYMYQYAGFTRPEYRGRRLMMFRGARARQAYLDRGLKGVLFNVESHNFRSLRATSRTFGVQQVGFIVCLGIGRLSWIHNSGGCRQHEMYLARPTSAARPVHVA